MSAIARIRWYKTVIEPPLPSANDSPASRRVGFMIEQVFV
jgi:hypothetical protein